MKNRLILILTALFALISCEKKDDNTKPIIILNANEIETSDLISNNGGSFTLNFSTTSEWTAKIDNQI